MAPFRFFNIRLSFQGRLELLFAAFMLIAGLGLVVIGYRAVANIVEISTNDIAVDRTNIIKNEILHTVRRPVPSLVAALARSPLSEYETFEERQDYLPVLAALLSSHEIVGAVFIGYDDGDFFMLHRLPDGAIRNYRAPPGSAFMVVNTRRDTSPPQGEHLFYSPDLKRLHRETLDEVLQFDPRMRPWYRDAMAADEQIETVPLPLHILKTPSVVFAERRADGKAVAGVAVLLSNISSTLADERPTPGSRIALLRPDGGLIASTDDSKSQSDNAPRARTVEGLSPILRLAAKAHAEGKRGHGLEMSDGTRTWSVSIVEAVFSGTVGNIILLAIPKDELLERAGLFLRYAAPGMAGILFICAVLVWFVARRVSAPLGVLAIKTQSIQAFLHEEGELAASRAPEIQALARSMKYIQDNIRKMLTITQTISGEKDFSLLLQSVLRETIAVAKANGGMILLLDEEKKIRGGEGCVCWMVDGEEYLQPFTPEKQDSLSAAYQALAQDVVIRTSIARGDRCSFSAHLAPGFADAAVTNLDALGIPLRDRMREQIGTLILFRAVTPGAAGFKMAEAAFIEAFAGTAAVALENQRLLKAQSALFDALIQILASAIDAKSPYTGGHCQRVPVLFKMLLEAACEAEEGPFKDFMLDEAGWEEAKLAGWLHDCGKVTTPEYVVDKATKLETIHDRIHEIRTRFEVLKRDAEIASLRAVQEGADPEAERQRLEDALRSLDEDFAFVASCNAGSEYMNDADLERLAAISKRTWLRTLDKRLGVSIGELARMHGVGLEALPVVEAVLADNPEHIIQRGEKDIPPPGEPWGFKLSPPQVLYNRGELYNLSIRKGTLTEEERYKINEHIMRTIIMLNALPLPRHLRRMPEIVGAHHETMDGKGYPRGLRREQMSIRAQMMAVADIFEALTASDRPYKPRKTLREALEIMKGLKETGHINPDVYDLFLQADIPRRYAEQYTEKKAD